MLNISGSVSIDIQAYIAGIINSFVAQNSTIAYKQKVEKTMLDYDEAVSIGLILNELITNSSKYAFQGIDNPCIDVRFYQNKNTYIFEYSDNGIGFDQKVLKSNAGLGFELIYGLIQKSNAIMNLDAQNGIKLSIVFNKGRS